MGAHRKRNITFFWKYVKKQKLAVSLLLLISAVNIGLLLINPQISRYFIDEATKGNGGKNLIVATLLFILCAFLAQLLSLVIVYIGEKVAWKATNDIRTDLITHCINLDMSFHKENKPGELLERVDGDVSKLFDLFSKIFLNVLNNFILLLGTLIILFYENVLIGISLTIFAIFAIVLLWKVKSKTENHWVKSSEVNAELSGFIGENISSTEDIASSGAREYVMDNFYKLNRRIFPVFRKARLTWATMWSVTITIFAVGTIIAFSVSTYLWTKGVITIGTAYLIFNYTQILRRPIEQIRVNIQELQVAGASFVRVNDLFMTKSSLKYGEETFDSSKPLHIKFNNVDFQYKEGIDVLKDVSIQVDGGRTLGVLGHTGSGKTSLARLIVRMYDIKSGEILLNNKNITLIREEEIVKNIAYITQDVQILTATVRDNITLFKKAIKDEDIIKTIYELGFQDWYESLPNGLDTYLELGSKSLSSGEAQLLSFIRVFHKNPTLIIFDEATSRMDSATEQLIDSALDKLVKNRTCIIIAHRLSTLNRAQDILLLENGKVVEFGERKTLLEDESTKYHQLLQRGVEEVLV
ncbi:ABC transporter ATP-binding protein [Bacillus sp. 123MFChir2]|uniref:ABC transporter ATP-binding protein n=1 Tax=Bacillus sp. 123MFChir2 TaxID=1169144 RepID=UPI0003773009|nr:ABC transporter ATP-binding protein [Bacillus sp. 123MFChir2]